MLQPSKQVIIFEWSVKPDCLLLFLNFFSNRPDSEVTEEKGLIFSCLLLWRVMEGDRHIMSAINLIPYWESVAFWILAVQFCSTWE